MSAPHPSEPALWGTWVGNHAGLPGPRAADPKSRRKLFTDSNLGRFARMDLRGVDVVCTCGNLSTPS